MNIFVLVFHWRKWNVDGVAYKYFEVFVRRLDLSDVLKVNKLNPVLIYSCVHNGRDRNIKP